MRLAKSLRLMDIASAVSTSKTVAVAEGPFRWEQAMPIYPQSSEDSQRLTTAGITSCKLPAPSLIRNFSGSLRTANGLPARLKKPLEPGNEDSHDRSRWHWPAPRAQSA